MQEHLGLRVLGQDGGEVAGLVQEHLGLEYRFRRRGEIAGLVQEYRVETLNPKPKIAGLVQEYRVEAQGPRSKVGRQGDVAGCRGNSKTVDMKYS